MKKAIFFLPVLFLGFYSNAQPDNYFRQRGVALLAFCAHPSNTFRSGTFLADGNSVIVDIFYEGGVHTRLNVFRGTSYFTRISVLSDNDSYPPFRFFGDLVETLLEQDKDPETTDRTERALENILRRSVKDWTGADWSLLFFNMDYASF